jgi:hypothetical protein
MKIAITLVAVLAASLFGSFRTFAQQMPGASSPGLNSALTKLFGPHTAFTAKSDVRVLDNAQKEAMKLSMDFAMLDGKMRAEVDVTQMIGKAIPPGSADTLKQMGMDRVISIIRPDKKEMFVIYPGLQSYAKMALPKEEIEAIAKQPKIEKTALGKETVDGHPCVKSKVTLTTDDGKKHEATVWNATDLKDFPVRIQTQERDQSVEMTYKQIKLARPDAKVFEPPAGFTEYDDIQKLMMGAAAKMMTR